MFLQGIDFMIKNENQSDNWQSKSNITDSTGATPQFDNKYSVFPRTPNNALLEPMFLGQPVNVARYDQQRYEVFEKLIEKQISFFWRPEEIDVSKDRIDYAGLPENEKHIFISNLKYQCLVEGTEVLTHKGWIDLTQYDGKSEILIYDLETGTTKWEVPEYKFTKQHKGDVYHFFSKDKQFEQIVTPEHRMPFVDKKTNTTNFKHADVMFFDKDTYALLNGNFIGNNNKEQQSVKDIKKTSEFWNDLTLTISLQDISRDFAIKLCDEVKKHKNLLFTEETANFIECVATIAGYLTRKTKFINSVDKTEKYTIKFTDKKFQSGKKIKKEKLQYDGLVSCVTVSTGAFVTRYKNSVTVSGNCLLDSVQGRSPNVGFLPVVSLPELETWIESWAFFESIHSRSYTHIIRNIVNNPGLIFDDIVVNEEILKRAEAISCYYDDLISYTNYYNMLGEGTHVVNGKEIVIDKRELKKKIYLCLVCVNVLEAIRFYVSFACSFAFAERELMEGNAKIIKMIARDEALHLTSTQHMINLMKSGQDDPEMKEIAHELEQETIEIFKIAAEQEKDWCDYLFKDGSMIGLNKDILVQYVEYITNLRMQAIGLEPIYPKATQNPIPWINNWLSSDNVQVAPQEVEISSYLIGQVDAEINSDELGGFEL